MTIHRIERIRMPNRKVFYSDYVIPRRPVIITNMFEGQPIASINTLDKAREAWGDVQLEITGEYSRSAGSIEWSERRNKMTISEYLAFVATNPDTRIMCTEYLTPSRVSAQFTLPDLCIMDQEALAEREVLNVPRKWGDHDLYSNFFLGNEGNFAHMHYDGDHRQVLLYQVCGRKRVILFQPSSGSKLDVLHALAPPFSNVYLQKMSEVEKLKFIDEADGFEAILDPGETIFMPMLIWHYLEYLDTCISVNFRFGRNRYGRFLCVDNFHRDYYLQNIATKMIDGDRYLDAIEEMKMILVKPCADRLAKVRTIRALFKRLCIQIAPEAEAEKHCPPEFEEQQIKKIVAELEGGVRYLPESLMILSNMQTESTVTPQQIRVIQSRIRSLGFSTDVMGKILYNLFAKSNITSLTKTEAALLLRIWSSPGAMW